MFFAKPWNYQNRAGISDYENIRIKLRELIKFIPEKERKHYDTNFTDDILSIEWNNSQIVDEHLVNYKKKLAFYIMQHQNVPAIAKLRGNEPLTPQDVKELEDILWKESGSKEQYKSQYGNTPLGELVRSIVGMSQQAANEAFSKFISEENLNSRQMYFVRQIVNYIVQNGMIKDISILQESPFIDQGSISELFSMAIFSNLMAVIEGINRNALVG